MRHGELRRPRSVEEVRRLIDAVAQILQARDKVIYDLLEKRKGRVRTLQNSRNAPAIDPHEIQYQVGDWVLVSDAFKTRHLSKTKLVWKGPYLVEKVIGTHLYELLSPLGKRIKAHSSRVRFYDGASFKMTEEVKAIFMFNLGRMPVEKLLDVRENGTDFEILVSWLGFGD